MIIIAKEKHINKMSEKIDDPKASTKLYWSVVNSFLNNMKISNILPLKVNDISIADFTVKAELYNSYFATQCTLIDNSCKLPVFKCNGKHRRNSFEINELLDY